MAALSSHINSYIHQSNGYNTVRGMGLSGFATNQSSVSWQKPGRSYASDPMDYALAMGFGEYLLLSMKVLFLR
jgi:hypothetical protein